MPEESERRADAQRNRDAVIAAGLELLTRDPTQSMQEIAEASGLGRTTLYRHFANREELFEAVFDEVVVQGRKRTGSVVIDGRDADEVVRELAEVLLDLCFRYGPLIAHREMGVKAIEASRDTDESPVRRFLVGAREDGQVRSDMPLRWQLTVMQTVPMQALDEVQGGVMSRGEARKLVAESLVSILIAD